MYGFHGRLLHIDLSTGQSSWVDLDEARLRAFLGGIGLGTSLLYEFAPPAVDPFSAANPLIFTSAPLVGTGLTTTAKYAVVTKSPLTGFIADSLSSSYFALELKRLGVDALVITGQAAAMAYIFICNDKVEISSAPNTCAAGAPVESEAAIRTELDRTRARVAAIGKAGENLVRFATISNEGRHAGRGGVGAVMGSKNLKAIALTGRPSHHGGRSDGRRRDRRSVTRAKLGLTHRQISQDRHRRQSGSISIDSGFCRRAIFSNRPSIKPQP